MACTTVENAQKFVSCYLDDYSRVSDSWIPHLQSGHPQLTCLLTITDWCVMFFGTMTTRLFAVTLDCSGFWSGAVGTELLCRQYVFPFIKWCHAMTLKTFARGVIPWHLKIAFNCERFFFYLIKKRKICRLPLSIELRTSISWHPSYRHLSGESGEVPFMVKCLSNISIHQQFICV